MKKKYNSPELDVLRLQFNSVLTITPSNYTPDPQNPERDGADTPPGEDL